jgi:DNA-binding transcriptional LysR family regulator
MVRLHMNLRSIDLNLLVLFDALIEMRSVRRAGERVGLSQSATSHALDRLRKLLGDELLVRTASGMEPTPRALSLAGPLRLALEDIQTALAPDRFEPAEAEIGLTIAVETHETIVILPLLVDEVRREAPGIALTVKSGSLEDILNGVDQGRVDVAIGLFKGLPDRFMTCRLLSDEHACVMRADHPLGRSSLTLDRYLDAPHLLISMSGGTFNAVDDALAEQGLRRRIVMQMPHGLAAVVALARSDMITSVTRGVARVFAATTPAVVMDLPFMVPASTFRLVWNRRFHADPARMWLRRKLVAIAAAVEAARDDC